MESGDYRHEQRPVVWNSFDTNDSRGGGGYSSALCTWLKNPSTMLPALLRAGASLGLIHRPTV